LFFSNLLTDAAFTVGGQGKIVGAEEKDPCDYSGQKVDFPLCIFSVYDATNLDAINF